MADQILAVIGTFMTIMVLGTMYLRNRHRERLALIQYGKTNEIFTGKDSKNTPFKFGLLLMSVGAGLLIGRALDGIFSSEPVCTFSSIFLLGGFSLIYYHHYIGRKAESENLNAKHQKDNTKDDFVV